MASLKASLKDAQQIVGIITKEYQGDLYQALLTYDSDWRRGAFKLNTASYWDKRGRAWKAFGPEYHVTVTYVQRNRNDGRSDKDILIWGALSYSIQSKARSEARRLAVFLRKVLYTELNPKKYGYEALYEANWDEVDTPTKRKRVTNAMVKVLKG